MTRIPQRLLWLCATVASLLPLLFCSNSYAQAAQFADPLDTPALVSQLAPRSLINGIAQAGTRIVAVGQRGHILLSDDQGQHWRQAAVPLSVDLLAVHFPSPQQGWVVGHDGVVLHSGDGGNSWQRQLDGRSAVWHSAQSAQSAPTASTAPTVTVADKSLLDVYFQDEQQGFIVGAFNLILHTADGGKSWQSWQDRIDNPQGLHLNAIRAVGGELYIVGEQGLVLQLTADNSRFQALITPYKGSFFGITGSATAIIAYGLRGNAYRSVDSGASWSKVETGIQSGLTAGTRLADGALVLLSQAGQLLISQDDGRSFQPVSAARPGPVSAVLPLATGGLLIGGARGLRSQALVIQ